MGCLSQAFISTTGKMVANTTNVFYNNTMTAPLLQNNMNMGAWPLIVTMTKGCTSGGNPMCTPADNNCISIYGSYNIAGKNFTGFNNGTTENSGGSFTGNAGGVLLWSFTQL
jgi:hypothetical protein